jgi:hypothetical protein
MALESKNKSILKKASPLWHVGNVELAYYHACDNRWQWFKSKIPSKKVIQEIEPEHYHRRQIGRLLHTVESSLNLLISKERSRDKRSLGYEMGDLTSLREQELFKEFIKYCIDRCKSEGLGGGSIKSLEELGGIPGGVTGRRGKTVDRDEIFTLMPIREDWDVIGTLGPLADLPPFKGDKWWTQFTYCVAFSGKRAERRLEQPFDSYDVQLWHTIGDDDVAYEDEKWNSRKPLDYFRFARNPFVGESKERSLYSIYSRFIDAVPDKLRSTDRFCDFYYVLPFPACGYMNFLQIQLVPIEGGRHRWNERDFKSNIKKIDKEIRDLFNDANDRRHLKECLREAVIQARLWSFEYHVGTWMESNRTRITICPNLAELGELAIECFCEFAPHLNEMCAIHVRNRHKDEWWYSLDHAPCIASKTKAPFAEDPNSRGEGKVSKIIEDVLKPWGMRGNRPPGPIRGHAVRRQLWNVADLGHGIIIYLFPKKSKQVVRQANDGRAAVRAEYLDQLLGGTNTARVLEHFESLLHRFKKLWYTSRA